MRTLYSLALKASVCVAIGCMATANVQAQEKKATPAAPQEQETIITCNNQFNGIVIVDGKVMPDGMKGIKKINPNSIESITVLKQYSVPDSLLNYSPLARNGVIIIDTKKEDKKIKIPATKDLIL